MALTGIWGFVIQFGVWALNVFIKDMQKREALKKSFVDFVEMRGDRARQTVELYKNAQEQAADLDLIEKQLREEALKKQKGEA